MASDTRYAYAVARVRGMETRLLDRQWIERLLSETPSGVLKALGDSAYQDALSGVTRPEDIEAGLERALAETLATIARVSPKPALIDLFRLRWDFRNLKALLKAAVFKSGDIEGTTVEGVGTVDVEILRKAVEERSFTPLPAVLADAARAALDDHRDTGEVASIDRACDAAMWAHSLSTARAAGAAFLEGYFRTEIDLSNIRAFVRIKEAGKDATDLTAWFAPGGHLDLSFFKGLLGEPYDALARALEFGRYAELAPVFREWSEEKTHVLEQACDNVLLKAVDSAKTVAYGIEPLVAYILRRQIEIKLIRTAVLAKLDGRSRSDVEERLRSVHV